MIRQEILRRQAVLWQQLAGCDTVTMAKYDMRLLDAECRNIVMQVMQGNLLPPSHIHTSEHKARSEDQSAKLGQSGSTAGKKSIGSSATSVQECHVGISRSASVATQPLADSVGCDHAAAAINIGSLVRLNHSPKPASTGSALAFASARDAVSGDVSGVRYIYECYLTNTEFDIRGGKEKRGSNHSHM